MTGIYYADIFKINGKGCLIMGYGKSKTCRHFTGENTEEIGIDSIRFEREINTLYGISDPTMGLMPLNNPQKIQLDYFIRMLSETETRELKISDPKIISMDEFIELCHHNIYFGCEDDNQRINEFKDITKDLYIKCLLIPWCETMEIKGEKIRTSVLCV